MNKATHTSKIEYFIGALAGLFGLLNPILGVIIYLIFRDKNTEAALNALIGAIISIFLSIVIVIFLLLSNFMF